jgi:translation initiation factor IF-1
MTRRFIPGVALIAALALPGYTLAHEGHVFKVMGIVQVRHENHLEVKATDGKTSMITLTEKTRVLRGKTKVKADEVRPGDRIVVTATESEDKDGKVILIASEIRLGTAAGAASK